MLQTEGHCLVFLPGEKEITNAISAFEKLRDEMVKDGDPCAACIDALPFHGKLSEEARKLPFAFHRSYPDRRMCLFTTNAAETSLTIENCRLVVDSGQAREVSYDARTRISRLNLVRISRSSADQRKGRAGRVCEGHCVRLYTEESIVRQNIEPEILRSSLDKTVLQLCQLQQDPLRFPLITSPGTEKLLFSKTYLQRIGCLQPGDEIVPKLMQRGLFMLKSTFDTILVDAITTMVNAGANPRDAVLWAAIATAPGSIYFFGDKKEEVANTRLERACRFGSETLELIDAYNNWEAQAKIKPTLGTRYAKTHTLNNKVLNAVRQTLRAELALLQKEGATLLFGGVLPAACAATNETGATPEPIDEYDYDYDNESEYDDDGSFDDGEYYRPVDADIGADADPALTRFGSVAAEALALSMPDRVLQILDPQNPVKSNIVAPGITGMVSIESSEALRGADFAVCFAAMAVTETRTCFSYTLPIYGSRVTSAALRRQLAARRYELVYSAPVGPAVKKILRPLVAEYQKAHPTTLAYISGDNATLYARGDDRMDDSLVQEFMDAVGRAVDEVCSQTSKRELQEAGVTLNLSAGLQIESIERTVPAIGLDFSTRDPPPSNEKEVTKLVQQELPSTVTAKVFYFKQSCHARVELSGPENDVSAATARLYAAFSTSSTFTRVAPIVSFEHPLDRPVTPELVTAIEQLANCRVEVDYSLDINCEVPEKLLKTLAKSVYDYYVEGNTKFTKFMVKGEADATAVRSADYSTFAKGSTIKFEYRVIAHNINHEVEIERRSATYFNVTSNQNGQRVIAAFDNYAAANEFTHYICSCATALPHYPIGMKFSLSAPPNIVTRLAKTAGIYGVSVIKDNRGRQMLSGGLDQLRALADSTNKAAPAVNLLKNRVTIVAKNDAELATAVNGIQNVLSEHGLGYIIPTFNTFESFGASNSSYFDKGEINNLVTNLRNNTDATVTFNHRRIDLAIAARCDEDFNRFRKAVTALRSFVRPWTMRAYDQQALHLTALHSTDQIPELAKKHRVNCQMDRVYKPDGYRPSDSTPWRVRVYGSPARRAAFLGEFTSLMSRIEGLTRTLYITSSSPPDRFGYRIRQKCGKRALSMVISADGVYRVTLVPAAPKPDASFAEECERIDKIANNVRNQFGAADHKRCVYCNAPADVELDNCFHAACTHCLHKQLEQPCARHCCPGCNIPVATKNLMNGFSQEELYNALIRHVRAELRARPSAWPLSTCPNCGTFQVKDEGAWSYNACCTCGKGYCHTCGITDQPAHTGRTCDEFEKIRGSDTDLVDALFQRACDAAHTHWTSALPSITSITLNPGIFDGCPAIQRFAQLVLRDKIDVLSDCVLAWHGSAPEAIAPICYDGLDPGRRRGQAYGRGEYFAPIECANVSYSGYCRNATSGACIIALIVRTGIATHRPGFCYVVDNDVSWRTSYCLPLAVLTYGDFMPLFTHVVPPRLISLRHRVAQHVQPRQRNMPMIALWKWSGDNRDFLSYTNDVVIKLETAYADWKAGIGATHIRLPGIIRLQNDVPDDYVVDFSEMKQHNVRTGYQRTVVREVVPQPPGANDDVEWCFYNEHSIWQPFDPQDQAAIELHYSNYANGANGPFVMPMVGRPGSYALNFGSMTQTNKESYTTRSMRRQPRATTAADKSLNLTLQRGTITGSALNDITNAVSDAMKRAMPFCFSTDTVTLKHTPQQITLSLRGKEAVTLIAVAATAAVNAALKHGVQLSLTPLMDESNAMLALLLPSCAPTRPAYLEDETWTQVLVAHAAIHQAGMLLYGGYVRDAVARDVKASDIDCAITSGTDDAAADRLTAALAAHGRCVERSRGPHALKLKYNISGIVVDVDIVDHSRITQGVQPFVDCDIDNLAISTDGLKLRKPVRGANLAEALEHARAEQFVFYYAHDANPGMYVYRHRKLFSKGFTALTRVHDSARDALQGWLGTQEHPDPAYDGVKWVLEN